MHVQQPWLDDGLHDIHIACRCKHLFKEHLKRSSHIFADQPIFVMLIARESRASQSFDLEQVAVVIV